MNKKEAMKKMIDGDIGKVEFYGKLVELVFDLGNCNFRHLDGRVADLSTYPFKKWETRSIGDDY